MKKESFYNTKPVKYKIELTDEVISSNSGLAMAGKLLGCPKFDEFSKPLVKQIRLKTTKIFYACFIEKFLVFFYLRIQVLIKN